MTEPPPNVLYYGDNLAVLRRHVGPESVDLIYLDPPFKSNQDYNVLFREKNGSQPEAQLYAFEDTWEWGPSAAMAYEEVVEGGGSLAATLRGLRTVLGENDMMAYLAMMAPRLYELHRVLKATGSIYLHCDQTASAYLRLLMDAIFKPANFRNELLWHYYNKMHDRRKRLFPRATDTILFYVKNVDANFAFHQLKEMRETPVKQLARKKVNGVMVNAKDADGHVIYRIKEDRTIDNVWRIPCLQPASSERLGYQTQKPEALLGRILEASSNRGDVILDPFCGCGTAIVVAQKLRRQWIGIDITQAAMVVIKKRLKDTFGSSIGTAYRVVGEPQSLQDAEVLARDDPYQFQWWVLGLVDARPAEELKGGDKGVDGRFYFHDEPRGGKTKQVIFSVKAGSLAPAFVRDLGHVVAREKAQIGVLLSLETPTKGMRREAATAGFYSSPGGTKHPRLQLLTVEEILGGRGVDLPSWKEVRTYKQARRSKPKQLDTLPLIND